MKIFIISLCFLAVAYSQIIRPPPNTEEYGSPIYEEIKVESVLTVRSKGSRAGKSASDLPQEIRSTSEATDATTSNRKRSVQPRLEILSPVSEILNPTSYLSRSSRGIHPKFFLPQKKAEGLSIGEKFQQ